LARRTLSIRVATAPGVGGEKLALRLLPASFTKLSLSELGLSPTDCDELRRYAWDSRGMMLVGGPTGAGKTTTVYALLQELKGSNRSVVTIEDPVEYLFPGVTQMQVNERQGLTFAEGIKGILRLDPDVIMMGEMRDRPSAQGALEAAESGHVVVSTLHARDAAGTLTVLRSFGFTDHEIAATVDLIVAQRLVRRLCPACRCQKPPTETEETLLRSCGITVPEHLWQPSGCKQCGGTGYRGRVGVFELQRLNEKDADLILGHIDEHTFRQHLRRNGTAPLFQDILSKAADGITSLSELNATGGFGFYVQQTT
jgi:general secretion pathway protein E